MKKILLSLLLTSIIIPTVFSQTFQFSNKGKTYMPLEGAISMHIPENGDLDPLTFSTPFMFNGTEMNLFQVVDGILVFLNSVSYENLKLYPSDANYVLIPGDSEVNYRIDGTAPNRVCIVEIKNLRFKDEISQSGSTASSFISFQVYVEEGKGAVSFHYGESSIKNFELCYKKHKGSLTGWSDNKDMFRELEGTPDGPRNIVTSEIEGYHPVLNGVPTSGTYYSWGDINVSTNMKFHHDLNIFPNVTSGIVNIKDSRLNVLSPKVDVYSSSGQLIKSAYLQKNQMDIKELPAGIYQLVVRISNNQYSAKIVKM